jgi:hypothetical protein
MVQIAYFFHQFGDVEYDLLFRVHLHPVGKHEKAEWASGNQFFGPGIKGFPGPGVVDALTLLF